jgi:hypothetical protein
MENLSHKAGYIRKSFLAIEHWNYEVDVLNPTQKGHTIEKDTNASKGTESFKKRKGSPTSPEQTA